jgi:hypothetical protein
LDKKGTRENSASEKFTVYRSEIIVKLTRRIRNTTEFPLFVFLWCHETRREKRTKWSFFMNEVERIWIDCWIVENFCRFVLEGKGWKFKKIIAEISENQTDIPTIHPNPKPPTLSRIRTKTRNHKWKRFHCLSYDLIANVVM